MKRWPTRRWFIERDIYSSHPNGDDWMIRYFGPGERRGEAKWYGSRAEALKDLRRRFNGHNGRIL